MAAPDPLALKDLCFLLGAAGAFGVSYLAVAYEQRVRRLWTWLVQGYEEIPAIVVGALALFETLAKLDFLPARITIAVVVVFLVAWYLVAVHRRKRADKAERKTERAYRAAREREQAEAWERRDRERDEQFRTLTERLDEQRALLQGQSRTTNTAPSIPAALVDQFVSLRDEIYALLVERAANEPPRQDISASDPAWVGYISRLARYDMDSTISAAMLVKRARALGRYINPHDAQLDSLVGTDFLTPALLRVLADRLGALAGVQSPDAPRAT